MRDPFGRTIDVVSSTPEQPGRDVFLTLDHTLQAKVESVLRTTVARWHALDGTAIVLDPRTGGVLAMAVAPGFDANDFSQVPSSMQRNRAVTDTYEPGSTFKVVTYAAALTDGIVNPNSSFSLPPSIEVADRTIDEAEPRPTETMTVAEMLARSSNVGTVMLAQLLGSKRLAAWITRFGFGRPTGIDFPGESPGIVLPLRALVGVDDRQRPDRPGDRGDTDPDGRDVRRARQPRRLDRAAPRRPRPWAAHQAARCGTGSLSAPVSQEVISMLQGVVSGGTGEEAAVPGYLVAGKTGTAAKPDASGGYSDTRYVASFVGIVPASAPRLVVLVSINEPQGQIFGGVVAAPAFRDIARFALQYLDVPPDDVSSLSNANAGAPQSG